MLVGIKNVSKLIGISIIACCAVLVCTMFLNFYFDIRLIESEITSELSMFFYNAQVSTAKVVCLVSGGCLLLTAIVMLLFYIKHYIDTHKKELAPFIFHVFFIGFCFLSGRHRFFQTIFPTDTITELAYFMIITLV